MKGGKKVVKGKEIKMLATELHLFGYSFGHAHHYKS